MAKVDLIHPEKGVPGKRYWVYRADPDMLDRPQCVQCYENGAYVKYVCRDGAMTTTMVPREMQGCRLVEIVPPDPADVLRYMKRQRLIKPKPDAAETANILGI